KKINIKFGNNCNLKCKMCFPYNSSELYKEWKALGWDASDKDPNKDTSWRFYEGYLEEDYKWPKDKSNLKKLMEAASASQILHITGGEPTIQPEFYAFLKYLIAKDKAKNITLELVTNSTKIHPSLFDLLGKFKTVMLMISMDAVGRTYEYIRYPANYSKVYENILKYRKFILSLGGESKMVFNYTLQVLNLHNTIESIKTLAPLSTVDDGFWIYELSDPNFMQWGMLPKESVKAEVKKIASHMDATKNIKWPVVALSKILEVHKHYKKQDYAKLKQQLIQFTKQQDNLRKINIKDYIPDLVDFTNEI
ncbi:MAG: twitch domain-containing radical SAM protein, partial [Bacteroidota bacterium]|nr:twitch domain-containing radical SAM protein [Bacteroidota bacterium]